MKNKIGKEAQMHLPLEMMFSILLIAVFLVVAFFVIRHFLEVQKCAQIGLFVKELQNKVDEAWHAQEASTEFEAELPSSIKYVCFINLSQAKNLAGLNTEEKEIAGKIYDDLAVYFKYRNANLFFYPVKAACDMPAHHIQHINLKDLNNPYCIHLSKIRIKLTKRFDESLVRITSVSEVPAKEQEKKVMEKEEYEKQFIDLSISTKQSLLMDQGESAILKVEKEHKLKLEEAALESAAIFLDSTFIRIKINETKMVDINRNGVADLAITLDNIQGNAAIFVFEKLVEDECAKCIAACSKSFTSLPPIIKDLVIVFAPSASVCLTRCQDRGLCEKEKFERDEVGEICKKVDFTIPAYEVVSISLVGKVLESTRSKTICGGTQDEIVAKAEQMKEEIAKEINKGDGVSRPREPITPNMITYKILEKEEIEPPSEPELKTKVCEGKKLKCCDKLLYILHGAIDPPPPVGQMPKFAECRGYYWTDCSASPSCKSIPIFSFPLVSQPVILESVSCTYFC